MPEPFMQSRQPIVEIPATPRLPFLAVQGAGWLLLVSGVLGPVIAASLVMKDAANAALSIQVLQYVAVFSVMTNIAATVLLLAEKMFTGSPDQGAVWSMIRVPALVVSFIVLTLWKLLGAYGTIESMPPAVESVIAGACAVMASSIYTGYRFANVFRPMASPETVIANTIDSVAVTVTSLTAWTSLPDEVTIRQVLYRLTRSAQAQAWQRALPTILGDLDALVQSSYSRGREVIYDLEKIPDTRRERVRQFLEDTVLAERRAGKVVVADSGKKVLVIVRREEATALLRYVSDNLPLRRGSV